VSFDQPKPGLESSLVRVFSSDDIGETVVVMVVDAVCC